MNERQKQTAFLKRLLQSTGSRQKTHLQNRIARSEQDERCVQLAMNLVGLLALLAAAGLCYSAVFIEDFFDNPTHMIPRLLGYLGLGSALCWIMFLGYWLCQRAATNRLYDEGRHLLMAGIDPGTTQFTIETCLTPFEPTVLERDNILPLSEPISASRAA